MTTKPKIHCIECGRIGEYADPDFLFVANHIATYACRTMCSGIVEDRNKRLSEDRRLIEKTQRASKRNQRSKGV